jgi:hypothetical protein
MEAEVETKDNSGNALCQLNAFVVLCALHISSLFEEKIFCKIFWAKNDSPSLRILHLYAYED